MGEKDERKKKEQGEEKEENKKKRGRVKFLSGVKARAWQI